jgi:hypothetical protein
MIRRLAFLGCAVTVALALALPGASAHAGSASKRGTLSAVARAVRYKLSHGYIPIGGPAAYQRYSAAAAARAARLHPQASRPASLGAAPVPGPSWQGVDENDLAPPDPTGAIGPNSYVEAINLQLAIYNRSGGLIAKAPFSTLTGTGSDMLSDPQVLFDVRSNRFYYNILDVGSETAPVSTMEFGFSKSNNPTSLPGDFCNYTLDFGWGGTIADYPKMGTTNDFVLIGVNIYPTLATFSGSDVGWIAKSGNRQPFTTCPPASVLKHGKVSSIKNDDGVTLASTPEPAVQTDPSSTGWIVAVPDSTNSGASGTKLELYEVTRNPNGTANIQTTGTPVTVPQYSPPAPAVQKNGPHTLDTLDGRLIRAGSAIDPSHGNKLAVWTSHTVFGGAGAEVRWYEIDPAAATLLQNGSVTDPNLFAFNGAVSPDRAVQGKALSQRFFGDSMVLGFNTSSANDFPAIQMVSKIRSNPQSGFVMVQASPGPEEGFDCWELGKCRWGDYSGASPDPAAPGTGSTGRVWLSNMWSDGETDPLAATWRTWNWAATP